jgi:hypothetical protein
MDQEEQIARIERMQAEPPKFCTDARETMPAIWPFAIAV